VQLLIFGAGEIHYALILMDMQMPKLDAARALRQTPAYRDTAIIAMTANAFAGDRKRCFESGMTDFLVKPFEPEALFATLLRALDGRKRGDPPLAKRTLRKSGIVAPATCEFCARVRKHQQTNVQGFLGRYAPVLQARVVPEFPHDLEAHPLFHRRMRGI
jgi:DNA-binding response OmpR family regulator